jgi:hypothetical protein
MSIKFTPDDRELLQQLLDDVGILEDKFRIEVPKPSVARTIFVPILRRWIAEDLFFKVQKFILPKKVEFLIPNHDGAIKLCEMGVYEYWMGLVMFGGIGAAIRKIAQQHLGLGGKPLSEPDDRDYEEKPRKAKAFFEQRMFFWKGTFYTRVDVIRMNAIALGGIHFDPRKAQGKPHIREVKNIFGYEIKGNINQMIIGDEISAGRADPVRRQQVYDATELIAMDTARIFANGIRASEQAFNTLLV